MMTPDERSRTLTYLHALRRKEGGYADHAGNARSGLQHTANAWKALCLLEDELPEPRATLAFVHHCFDRASGGFCERPRGAPTVLCTALALALLRGLRDQGGLAEYSPATARFLAEQARSAMDHFFVVAAHDEGDLAGPPPTTSVEFFRERRLPDGTFGDSTFANAIAACALLRAGGKLPQPATIVSRLLSAQTSEGGFADLAGPPDLLTTYAATRALALLARQREAAIGPGPDQAALDRYLRGLRRPEGGYAMCAGGATSAGATYHALAVSAWTLKLRASGSASAGAARAAAAARAGRGSRTA
jgi:prenyltransferase beta subunit